MGGDATDVLAGMLKAPIQRGLLLMIEFMQAQGSGTNADAARTRVAERHRMLLEKCSEMAMLALKRDVLSRAGMLAWVSM